MNKRTQRVKDNNSDYKLHQSGIKLGQVIGVVGRENLSTHIKNDPPTITAYYCAFG